MEPGVGESPGRASGLPHETTVVRWGLGSHNVWPGEQLCCVPAGAAVWRCTLSPELQVQVPQV